MGRFIPPALRSGSEELHAAQAVYEAAGCYCYRTDQHRRTHATKGLWDMYVLHPMLDGGWWHEGKHGNGRLTDEQVVFGQRLEVCRVPKVVGGEAEARAYLTERGILRPALPGEARAAP